MSCHLMCHQIFTIQNMGIFPIDTVPNLHSSTVIPADFQAFKFNCQLDMWTSLSPKHSTCLNWSSLSPFSKLLYKWVSIIIDPNKCRLFKREDKDLTGFVEKSLKCSHKVIYALTERSCYTYTHSIHTNFRCHFLLIFIQCCK